jgi:hypothetical protein
MTVKRKAELFSLILGRTIDKEEEKTQMKKGRRQAWDLLG